MEKKQYELCFEILRRFHRAGILNHLVIIGSWCVVFYEKYFDDSQVKLGTLRTRDIDFLIQTPSRIKESVDIPELLKDLGFVVSFMGEKGFIKLDHPDLIVEFLVPEKGKGTDKSFRLSKLGINATALRFLDFLSQDMIRMPLEDFSIHLPHPCRFALHKLIIGQRRTKEDKALKDIRQGISILEILLNRGDEDQIRKIFMDLPSRWKTKILKSLKQVKAESLFDILAKR